MYVSAKLKELYEQVKRAKVKRRLKAAFKRKKPVKVVKE